MIKTELSGIFSFVEDSALPIDEAREAYAFLKAGNYAGYDGWRTLPETYSQGLDGEIKSAAAEIIESSSALVVIGIGGSYLGARAVLEAIRTPDYNLTCGSLPRIFFCGTSLSSSELSHVASIVSGCDFSVNVISKSGSTIEPSVAYRVFFEILKAKYGEEGARKRVYVTTDPEKGNMRAYADKYGLRSFSIPRDAGGRFSVLTPVGLLPLAAAGIDPERLMNGARAEMESGPLEAIRYAAARRAIASTGRTNEVFASFEPSMRFTGEWWKQLFGESEGKNGGGIFPASVIYTADLHSMGQYMQQGKRDLFETFVNLSKARSQLRLPRLNEVEDGLSKIEGMDIAEMNEAAKSSVKAAHIEGGVPVIEIDGGELSAESMGALLYFFETACAVSAIMQRVNPFDQPGVESYKKKLFTTLGIR